MRKSLLMIGVFKVNYLFRKILLFLVVSGGMSYAMDEKVVSEENEGQQNINFSMDLVEDVKKANQEVNQLMVEEFSRILDEVETLNDKVDQFQAKHGQLEKQMKQFQAKHGQLETKYDEFKNQQELVEFRRLVVLSSVIVSAILFLVIRYRRLVEVIDEKSAPLVSTVSY